MTRKAKGGTSPPKADQPSRLVGHVMRKLRQSSYFDRTGCDEEDAQQEAYVAALVALPQWDESKGKLSTFLVPRIMGAVKDYCTRKQSKYLGLDEPNCETDDCAENDDNVSGRLSDQITYDDSIFGATPEQYVSPERLSDRSMIADIVNQLRPNDRKLVSLYFGLFGEKDHTLTELAKRYRKSVSTIASRLKNAMQQIVKLHGSIRY